MPDINTQRGGAPPDVPGPTRLRTLAIFIKILWMNSNSTNGNSTMTNTGAASNFSTNETSVIIWHPLRAGQLTIHRLGPA